VQTAFDASVGATVHAPELSAVGRAVGTTDWLTVGGTVRSAVGAAVESAIETIDEADLRPTVVPARGSAPNVDADRAAVVSADGAAQDSAPQRQPSSVEGAVVGCDAEGVRDG
jgi:hypothetical protein